MAITYFETKTEKNGPFRVNIHLCKTSKIEGEKVEQCLTMPEKLKRETL